MKIKTEEFIKYRQFILNVLSHANQFSEMLYLDFENNKVFYRNDENVMGTFSFEYEKEEDEEITNFYVNGYMLLDICRFTDWLVLDSDYTFHINGNEYKMPYDTESENYLDIIMDSFEEINSLENEEIGISKDFYSCLQTHLNYLDSDVYNKRSGTRIDKDSIVSTDGKIIIRDKIENLNLNLELTKEFVEFLLKVIRNEENTKLVLYKNNNTNNIQYGIEKDDLTIIYPINTNNFQMPPSEVVDRIFNDVKAGSECLYLSYKEITKVLDHIKNMISSFKSFKSIIEIKVNESNLEFIYNSPADNIYINRKLEFEKKDFEGDISFYLDLTRFMIHFKAITSDYFSMNLSKLFNGSSGLKAIYLQEIGLENEYFVHTGNKEIIQALMDVKGE